MKPSPNRLCLISMLPVLLLGALTASAAPTATGDTQIVVSCDHRYISQRDAARVMKTDNFSQTYDKRQSLYANLARQCHRGIDQVLLTRNPPTDHPRTVAAR